MHKPLSMIVVLSALATPPWAADAPSSPATAPRAPNPFSEPSQLPYALPPFDSIKDSDFEPAFEAGMLEQRARVDAIAHDPEPATLENTLVALERSSLMLDRVSKVFFNLDGSNTDPDIQKIKLKMTPRLAAHLAQRYYTLFVRAGARLGGPEQERLRNLNQRVAELNTRFEQNAGKATNEGAVVVDDRAALDGLSPEQIGAAEQAARARALEGKWVIGLQNTTIQPVLAQLKSRALRERIYRASIGRADGGDTDNTAVIAELVRLRAERARLLGYPDHAAY